MLKRSLLAGVIAAQSLDDSKDGDVCFGYDTCNSGCCLRNILPELDYFYPNKGDLTTYTDADITAIEEKQSNLLATGTKTEKDGITYYTSADGTTYKDVAEHWLTYKPQFSDDIPDRYEENTEIKKYLNYQTVVCQSNVTMCEGVADPFDLSNIESFDDALAAANAIGGALITVIVLVPLIFFCLCVCFCKSTKVLCFKEEEQEAPP